jgi:hypothetical protein
VTRTSSIVIQPATPAAPVISPSPGSYKLPQLISIFSAEPDAILYYVVNDGRPTRYKAPFPLRGMDTVQAVVIVEAEGQFLESPVAWATYRAEVPPPEPPVLSPAGGTFRAPQIVTLKPVTPGASLFYSINRASAQRYTAPITLAADATIEAVAIGSMGSVCSESPVVVGAFKFLP